jgi:hypothetical protein
MVSRAILPGRVVRRRWRCSGRMRRGSHGEMSAGVGIPDSPVASRPGLLRPAHPSGHLGTGGWGTLRQVMLDRG